MPNKMSQDDKSRIMSAQAQAGKDMGKGSFPARAQSAADTNTNQANQAQGGQGGQAGQGGQQGEKK